MTNNLFIVVYRGVDPVEFVYGMDPDCEGALGGMIDQSVAIFQGKKAANRAITITVNWNKLLKSQGKVYNDDFLERRDQIHVIPAHIQGQE